MPVLSWRQMEHYYRNGNGVFLGDWLAYSSPSWISNQVCLEFEVPKVTCSVSEPFDFGAAQAPAKYGGSTAPGSGSETLVTCF